MRKLFILILFPLLLLAENSIITEWESFETDVRDGKLTQKLAKEKFSEVYNGLRKYGMSFSSRFKYSDRWIFPVVNYSIKDAGKGGFKPEIYYGSSKIKGYNFYDGNLHGGHPAYDIFVKDKNFDSIDDNSKKPVSIAAPTDLLILSLNKNWKKGDKIRGGNYIWGLEPKSGLIFYFAHLNEIEVAAGDFCERGKKLGTLGRTGKNADQKSSPTHLHFMVLKVDGFKLTPIDTWESLKKAK